MNRCDATSRLWWGLLDESGPRGHGPLRQCVRRADHRGDHLMATPMYGLEWVERLPGRGGEDDLWEDRAVTLQDVAGRWAVVAGERDRGRVLRHLIRFGRDGGRFEVAQRTVKGEEPRVYARWVADEGTGA